MKCRRIPFNLYMPESMLTKEMKKADRKQEEVDNGKLPPETSEEGQE